MLNKSFVLLSIVFAFSVHTVTSEELRPEGIASATNAVYSKDLIHTAFELNPDIQSAKAKWAQTIERYPQETSLEDPVLNFSYYVENVETRVGPQNYSVGISQKFPFPGTLRQKGRVVEKEIAIASLQYEKTVRDVIAELKHAIYEIQYLDGAIDITRNNQNLLKEILAFTQNQYTRQNSSLNDVFRAESQLAQLDYDLITLHELRAVQQTVINSILNRPSDALIGFIASPIPKEATFAIDELDRLVQTQNQEIRLSQLGVEKSEESVRLAQKRTLPTFSLGANYIDTGNALNATTLDSGKDPVIVGGGMSIPLWFGKNRALVRYAKEGRKAAGQQHSSVLNGIKVDLRKTFFKLQNAHRLVVLYRDHLIPQAEHSLQIAEEWNGTKPGNSSELLEVQSVWLNFNLAWLRAQIDYAQSLVQLEQLAGGSLSSLTDMER